MQTSEDRIRRQFKSLKKLYYSEDESISAVWVRLARQWNRPIREIKEIVGYKQGR